MKIVRGIRDKIRNRIASGFTILEVMIAAVLLILVSVGLLGLFSQAVLMAKYSQDDLIAREKARQALEMILSAKTTGQLTFSSPDNLENIGSAGGSGVFLGDPSCTPTSSASNCWQSLMIAGPDGLMGTSDDGCYSCSAGGTVADSYLVPGTPGASGSGSISNLAYSSAATVPSGATVVSLANFQRQITISTATNTGSAGSLGSGTMRLITVTVRYPMHPSGWRTYTVTSYIASYE